MPVASWGSPINGSPSCSRQLRGKASAPMGVAFALLAPADPRAIAGLDHAGTRLDDLHPVVLHVVIRLKTRANLDAPGASTSRIELKNAATDVSGTRLKVRSRAEGGPRPDSRMPTGSTRR